MALVNKSQQSDVRKIVGANNYSPDKMGVSMIGQYGQYEIQQKFVNKRSVYIIFNTATDRPEPGSYDFMTIAILAAIEMG